MAERVVVFDGAAGSNLQLRDLNADDFGGPSLEGCNEMLVLTRPDVIADLHDSFFAVGVDVVETDTFGAFDVVLNEYQIPEKSHEINVAAARIAREVASGYEADGRTRYVAGSIGPGTKLPSLGHIDYATLRDGYQVQAAGLLEGGVDLFVHRDVHGPAPGQGRGGGLAPGHDRRWARRADPAAGNHGDHGPHARRLRDRRRAGVARRAAARRVRHQLRHGPGRDAGAPALPVAALPAAHQRAAQRGPAPPSSTARPTTT